MSERSRLYTAGDPAHYVPHIVLYGTDIRLPSGEIARLIVRADEVSDIDEYHSVRYQQHTVEIPPGSAPSLAERQVVTIAEESYIVISVADTDWDWRVATLQPWRGSHSGGRLLVDGGHPLIVDGSYLQIETA